MQFLHLPLLLAMTAGLLACEMDGPEATPIEVPIEVASFNIQFLGNFKNKQNEVLAQILERYDLVFVQELVAPPIECTFPDGDACRKDDEATAFFDAMGAVGFSYVLSPEDTGTGSNIHLNSAATEWWVAFYRDGRIEPATDLPVGFLADDRSDHPDYERVPYAFGFRFDGRTDMVFISTHLKPGHSGSDQDRRAHELNSIFGWIDANDEIERDFVVLGDMNIDDCDELDDVTPNGWISLNGACQTTNTNPNGPRPYDHVIYNVAASQLEIGIFFEVVNLIEAVRPFWIDAEPFPGDPYVHNDFRTRFSDHHPVHFQITVGTDDD